MGESLHYLADAWYYGVAVVGGPIFIGCLLWYIRRLRRRRRSIDVGVTEEANVKKRKPAMLDALVFERGIGNRRMVSADLIDDVDNLTIRFLEGKPIVLLEEVVPDGAAEAPTTA